MTPEIAFLLLAIGVGIGALAAGLYWQFANNRLSQLARRQLDMIEQQQTLIAMAERIITDLQHRTTARG